MAFTHLHVHTEYSLLDGAARIKDVVKRAKELGMEALAITDHGVMFGVVDFYKECKKAGIKPIIGCEVYTAARTMDDKEASKDRYQGHLVLFAKDEEGYKNIIKIVSEGYTRGFYYKPRIDKDCLRRHQGGIIATSACLQGDVQRHLVNQDYESAKKEALELEEIFGKGNFFLEIQDQGLEEEALINPLLKKLSEDIDIPLIATNDVHYINQDDAEAHDVLLCIQTQSKVADEKRMRFSNDQFYLKSEDEMRKIFAAYPEAVDNTQIIVDACNFDFEFNNYHIPKFECPDGLTTEQYMRKICDKGFAERYGDEESLGAETYKELRDRLEYEISTIAQMGYIEYFLIVWDFINYAKENGIMVGPGRGSAAGSIVAYTMRITDIDPIKNVLIFERFLNPERVSMPDIDVDFCIERRGEVIEYVNRKYGEANVSQIITFGTMKAKNAIRDVARVYDISYGEADSIAKMIPDALKMTIEKALEQNKELADRYEQDETCRKVIDMAIKVEGMPRQPGTHAAGVVISSDPLDEFVPMYVGDKGLETQFTMTTIEELGLLKMDFLGLRNLTVIRDALAMIKENHGVDIDFQKMEYDDPKVYKLIAAGDTEGVFQLESGGMTSFMKNLAPDCFEDIVAGISLYRPGPMDSIPTYIANKKNPDKIAYVDPHLEPILAPTYGCLVYQEQVMQIVRDLAGYTYGQSDLVRRAMSKKKMDVMLKEREYFIHGKEESVEMNGKINPAIKGCLANGISEEAANAIFDDMITFAQYAFNKSHAAAYAVVSYETAYLKAYYPAEFMAALMTSEAGNSDKIAKYIRSCESMGIEVLPPCANESEGRFTVKDGKVRFGLIAIKNLGEGPIREIIRAREEKGKPRDIFQFIDNLDISQVNKKAVESLINSGALDCFQPNRNAHLKVYESLMESAQNEAKNTIDGQTSLFDFAASAMSSAETRGTLPDVPPESKEVVAFKEKELLGLYMTWHPLDDHKERIRSFVTATAEDLNDASDPEKFNPDKVRDKLVCSVGGIITGCREFITKNNTKMAFLEVEDLTGTYEVVVFAKVYEEYREFIHIDSVVAIKGSISLESGESGKVLAQAVLPIVRSQELAAIKVTNNKRSKYGNRQNSKPASSQDSSAKPEDKKPASAKPSAKAPNPEDNASAVFENAAPAGEAAVPEPAPQAPSEYVVKLRIPESLDPQETIDAIKGIAGKFKGNTPVLVYLATMGKAYKMSRDFWVMADEAYEAEMVRLLGKENYKQVKK